MSQERPSGGPTQQKLLEKAKSLPKSPGCYLMKNRSEEVIYVGKAKELKNRVSSYFRQGQKSVKTEILVSHIRDFDFIITQNDTEAYVLENNLIKKHSPKYNIRLKDDKSYPYVVIDKAKAFPRLLYQRRVKRTPKKKVFGPFAYGSNISEVLRVMTKSFQLRDCTDREMNSRKEPCLFYQMHQCTAPCVGKVTDDEYSSQLQMAEKLFSGKGKKVIAELEAQMMGHAENERFEKAAQLRDSIEVLQNFLGADQQKNAELQFKEKDIDILSFHIGESETDLAIYLIRNNFLLGHKNFHFSNADSQDETIDEVFKFVLQYYRDSKDTLPKKLVHPFSVDGPLSDGDIEEIFHAITGKKVASSSVTSRFEALYDLTLNQAQQYQKVRMENKQSVYVGLNKLKDLLSLKERPVLLECYDIAIWQGKSPTASQVVFHDGFPEKKSYRYYHLEELPEGNNDFEMMRQVISRRLKYGSLPDVFVIDGGKAQVNTVREVLKTFEVDVPVVGIAKARSEKGTEERLIIPGRVNPYLLGKNRSLLTLLVQMRDEAHRFSRKLHHKKEKSRQFTTLLDQVSGVGPKTKEKVYSKLDKPLTAYKNLSIKEFSDHFDIKESFSKKILNFIEGLEESETD